MLDEGEAVHAQAICNPIDTAPKDGTLVRLRVDYSGEGAHALWDTERFGWTIGFNNFQHDEIDAWKFAGWDWAQDEFVEGRGTPVGWLPFHGATRKVGNDDYDTVVAFMRSAWHEHEALSKLGTPANDALEALTAAAIAALLMRGLRLNEAVQSPEQP
ncbi:MAG TPA: hypothetical protein PLS69_05950 [Terricaulis sp.]|nr:hypothetical protein [Terricaulis sp.]